MKTKKWLNFKTFEHNTIYIVLMLFALGICYAFGLLFRLLSHNDKLSPTTLDYGAAILYALPSFALSILLLLIWSSLFKRIDYASIPQATKKRFETMLSEYSSMNLKSFDETIKSISIHTTDLRDRKNLIIYLKHEGFQSDVMLGSFNKNKMVEYIKLLEQMRRTEDYTTAGMLVMSCLFAGFICMLSVAMSPAIKKSLWLENGTFNIQAFSQLGTLVIGVTSVIIVLAKQGNPLNK